MNENNAILSMISQVTKRTIAKLATEEVPDILFSPTDINTIDEFNETIDHAVVMKLKELAEERK